MFLALLLLLAFILEGFYWGGGRQVGNNTYFGFLAAVATGPQSFLPMALPLVACLIAGDVLALDKRSGRHVLALVRTSRVSYALQKVTLALALTGSVILAGLLIGLGLSFLLLPRGVPPAYSLYPFLSTLLATGPGWYVFIVAILMTLSAMAWASVSLLISIWTSNPYMVLGIPWVIYMVLTIILQSARVNLTEFAPLMLSGPVIALTTGASQAPYVDPMILILLTLVCSGLVVLSYARGGDILE
jgi:hypothetical protein